MTDLVVRYIGLQPYLDVWHAMQNFTEQRDNKTMDEIWCLQHSPVFTQGQAGKPEHLLDCGDIPVVQVDRGGQVTYHGPGQLVIYLMIDLKRRKLGARALVSGIEASIVKLLADYQLSANAKPDAPGVYVDNKKIASLGLRIRGGCSFHGLALNIAMDLSPFSRINPCGYADMTMVNLTDYIADVEKVPKVDAVAQSLVGYLMAQFGYSNADEYRHL